MSLSHRTVVRALLLVALVGSLPAAAESEALWKLYITEGKKAFDEGRFPDAEELFSQSLVEAHRFARPGDRPAWSHAFLAQVYTVLQRYEEADRSFGTAVKGLTDLYGPGYPYLARVQVLWGQSFLDRQDYRAALAHLDPAIRIYESLVDGPDPKVRLRADDPNLAIARGTAGYCHVQLGQPQQAERLLAQAIPVLEARADPEDAELATLKRSYATARSQLGKPPAEAVALAAPPPARIILLRDFLEP